MFESLYMEIIPTTLVEIIKIKKSIIENNKIK